MSKVIAKNLILLIIIVVFDQLLKITFLNLIPIHRNYGVFLGFFSDAPIAFRIITLATFAGFLFSIYGLLLYLLPKKTNFLKYILTFIIGGIFGNIIDRLTRGFTIDFIPVKIYSFEAYYNIADIFLFLGVFSFVYSIFKFEKHIWHPDNSRNTYLVNPKEQIRLAFKFFLVSIFTALIIGLFSYTFIKSFLRPSSTVLSEYIITYIILASLFSILVFLIGIIISHKSSGPLYAFELYVERLIQGETEEFTLRDGDNYKHLEEVANKLLKYFKK